MVEQFLGVSVAAVGQHDETALARRPLVADDRERFLAHALLRAGRFIGDHLENIAIEVLDADLLGAIAIGPGKVEIGPAVAARRMRAQGAFEATVDAIDMDVHLVLRPASTGIDRHADIRPGQGSPCRCCNLVAVAPGVGPEIGGVGAQQQRAFDARDLPGRHNDDPRDVIGRPDDGEAALAIDFQAWRGQAEQFLHRRANIVNDAPEIATIRGARFSRARQAQAGEDEEQAEKTAGDA